MKLEYAGTIIVNANDKSEEIAELISDALAQAGYSFTTRNDTKFSEKSKRISLFREPNYED